MKLWLGKEREGRLKGAYTLFVGSSEITYDEIKEVLNEHSAVKQIYFGAGICTSINYKVIEKCTRYISNKIVTAEIRLDDLKHFSRSVLDKIFLVITFDDNNKRLNYINPKRVQIKLQTLNHPKLIAMVNLTEFDLIDIKGLKTKIYLGDKVLK